MKTFSSPIVALCVLVLIGSLLWLLLDVAQASFLLPFVPALVFFIFLIAGFFVFFIMRHFMKTRRRILQYGDAVEKSNDRYKLVVSGLSSGYWDWNIKTGEVFFSDEWRRAFSFFGQRRVAGVRSGRRAGTPEDQAAQENATTGTTVLGNDFDWWMEQMHPEDVEVVKKRMELYFSGSARFYEAEYRLKTGNGQYVWVLDRGQALTSDEGEPLRMAGVTTIIQNQKNVEEVLRNKTNQLEEAKVRIEREKGRTEAVLQSIGEGVIAVNREGLITIANPASASLLGLEREKMLGKSFSSVVPKEENKDEEAIPEEERLINKSLKSGELYSKTLYYYCQDETKIPVAATAAPIILDNELAGVIVVFRDITREMEIDQQKTEFVSLASHQLRTPLSAIRWYSEMVLGQKIGKLNEKQEKYVQEVYDSNLRMIELVNGLLNVSRIELGTFAVEPEKVDMEVIFDSVIDELAPYMREKKLHFVKDYEDMPKEFYVDRNLIRIVFQNLLSNSVKYTQEGGNVSISVRRVEKFLHVEVSDNGYGIPAKDQPKMFTKLYRASNVQKKDTEGTGLGLYIIKSVVEKTGGKIWFESEEGKGTTFFVELPMSGMTAIEGTRGLEM